LLICCPDCRRSPGRTSNCWVFRGTVKLLSCMNIFSRGSYVVSASLQHNSREAFSLLGQLPCMPQSPPPPPRRSSDCGVGCSVALYTEELLGCLQAVCLQGSRQTSVCCSVAFCALDLLGCLLAVVSVALRCLQAVVSVTLLHI
jgi:hypothetical protein